MSPERQKFFLYALTGLGAIIGGFTGSVGAGILGFIGGMISGAIGGYVLYYIAFGIILEDNEDGN